MKQNNENTNAFLLHLSAFAGFIFPFGNIIAPLVAWQTLKDRSPKLDTIGKEVVNFNLSYTLYFFIISVFSGAFLSRDFFRNKHFFKGFNSIDIDFNGGAIFGFLSVGALTGIVYLIGIALVIIASIKARDGENYQYPFTIKFIK